MINQLKTMIWLIIHKSLLENIDKYHIKDIKFWFK